MNRSIGALVTGSLIVLASAAYAQAPGGATMPGQGAAGAAGTAARGGTGQTAATGSAIRSYKNIVLDTQRRQLIITTTPAKHRKIQALLARLARDPHEGKKMKTKVFNLMTLSQQEFFDLVKYSVPGVDPSQTDRMLVMPETSNRPVFQNDLPAAHLLPAPTQPAESSGGSISLIGGTGSGSSSGSGSQGSGGQ